MDPLTPADVRRLLDEHGLAPRKAAGQNFVIDPNTVRKIVRDAGIPDGVPVLEIGPGLGSLTIPLAEAAPRVVAVEIDAGLAALLERTLASLDHVEIVHADALGADLGALVDGGPAVLVANLPYNVATPLIVTALDHDVFVDAYVMVQREVGERWSAAVGDPLYAGVSVKLDLVAEVRVEDTIPRSVFYPVPNVDSVMVRLTPRPDRPSPEVRDRVRTVVDAAFAQRRKTLRNTLRSVAPRQVLDAAFAAADVPGGARAEELDTGAFVRLTAALDAELRRAARTMPSGGAG